MFLHLRGYEDAIRTELDVEVRASSSDSYAAGDSFPIDTRDRGNWETMADWLHERLEGYQRALSGPADDA